ncbi:phospholipase D-like domain-containing protein [Virgibacillus kekensis]|uniref:phospholipase D n=1 Tax=Virgibacillus kekensis TaxID=202261 RepID=A0ABV9DJ94_9BACI
MATGAAVSSVYYYFKNNDVSRPSKLRYYFSKSDASPREELTNLIDNAQNTIDAAVFYITEKKIIAHLCNATKRGVEVRIITDKDNDRALDTLVDCGIPIKVNTYKGNMHLKNMIVDKKIATTGSYNFTYNAEFNNEEVVIILDNKEIAGEWSAKFEKMWNDKINYKNYESKNLKKYA